MSPDLFLALLVYAFVASVTPGPNNMMLMASGVNFGFRRTIPHMLGIAVGFFVLLLAVGFGLGALLHAVPGLQTAMKGASAAYMLWLAWRIATAGGPGEAKNRGRNPAAESRRGGFVPGEAPSAAYAAHRRASATKVGSGKTRRIDPQGSVPGSHGGGRPLTFLQAASFQWVNPKAWAMALVAMGAYTNATAPVLSVLLVATAFALVNFPSVSVWAGFGVALRGFLADPRRLRAFNVAMGLALAATIWPLLR